MEPLKLDNGQWLGIGVQNAEVLRAFCQEIRENLTSPDAPIVTITAPCEQSYTIRTLEDVPEHSLRCRCGSWLHWVIRYEDEEPIKYTIGGVPYRLLVITVGGTMDETTMNCWVQEGVQITLGVSRVTQYAGIRAPDRATLVHALAPYMIGGRSLTVKEPCGEHRTYQRLEDIPDRSVPAPCSNSDHWFIKYEGAH